MAFILQFLAPPTSFTGQSPTCTTSSGSHSTSSKALRKCCGDGLFEPTSFEQIEKSKKALIPMMLRSALPFDKEPITTFLCNLSKIVFASLYSCTLFLTLKNSLKLSLL